MRSYKLVGIVLAILVFLGVPSAAQLTDKQKKFEEELFAQTQIFDRLYQQLSEENSMPAVLTGLVNESELSLAKLAALNDATIENLKTDSTVVDIGRWNSLEKASHNQTKAFQELIRGAKARLICLQTEDSIERCKASSDFENALRTSDLYLELVLTNVKQAYLWDTELLERHTKR